MNDLIIVGAGPAGLMAAYRAALKGLKVVLVETKKDVTVITRACSEQIVLDENYEKETVKIEDDKIVFTKNGFSVPYDGPKIPICHNYMFSPKGHKVTFEHDDLRPEAMKIDKGCLLKGLISLCEKQGVDLRMHTTALSGEDNGKDGVSLKIRSEGKEETISAKKLIIAEGVNCKLTEIFGLNEGRMFFGMPLIVTYTVEGTKGLCHNSWSQFYGNVFHPFSEIMVGESTKSDDALEITVGGIKDKKPDMFFNKLLKDSPLSENLKDARIISKAACAVKSYLSLETPYKGNVLAIGDSAAHVEVVNQGALMCGYHAADAIFKELNGEDGFKNYALWWNDAFEFNVKNKKEQIMIYGKMNIKQNLSDDEIDYVFALLEGERLCGNFNQFEVPKNFWRKVLEYSDRIQKENPALYEKMAFIRGLKDSAYL